jgi:hypothetical protein
MKGGGYADENKLGAGEEATEGEEEALGGAKGRDDGVGLVDDHKLRG